MTKNCISFDTILEYEKWLETAKRYTIITSFVFDNKIVITYIEEEIPHF